MQLSNITGISIPLSVWLAADGYDFYRGERKAISATSLLKPVRRILLAERLTENDTKPVDVSELIAARLGHTIHDGIEKAWTHDYKSSLQKLGYPQKIIDRVVVNPKDKPAEDAIPVYLEQRCERDFLGYAITGKFDMIFDGELNDFKSTSVYTHIYGGKDRDYQLQGSIYRWLNQDKVTADHIAINFIFTDWSRAEARRKSDYPQQRVMVHRVALLSIEETEAWMRDKIRQLEASADLPESDLPFCTDEELWKTETIWKYYADAAKANDPNARSTRNFPVLSDAKAFQASKGGAGALVEIPGKAKACGYCPVFDICTQKDLYEHA